MPRVWRLAWVGLMAVGLGAVPARAVHPRGQVLRVGFSGSGRTEGELGTDHVRIGFYTPILVELTNDDADTFSGVIEARQTDRDGDELVARREVMVTGARRYYLYLPCGEGSDRSPFSVRVLDSEGSLAKLYNDRNEPVRELVPSAPPTPIEIDARVILDISKVNGLRDLTRDTQLNRPVTVLRVAAQELPDDPVGLEMADTIVWDEGDPEVMDLPKREALREWTRRGGRLVIGVSRNWQQLSEKFGDLLPAKLSGTAQLKEVNAKWADGLGTAMANPFDPPLSYCPVRRADLLPGAMAIVPESYEEKDPLLAIRRPYGRGEVVLVTAELRELTDPKRRSNLEAGVLLRMVVGSRRETNKQDQNARGMQKDLFEYVKGQTGFQVMTQLYLLFAFMFVAGYVLLATGGSWVWLRKRKLVQHAWGSFALVAVVASVAGLAVVHLIRGVGFRVQELAFVDADANSPDATAIVYYGLKTPTHTTLDLRVAAQGRSAEETPEGTTSLRPLPVDTGGLGLGSSQYRAGLRYEAVSALGELRGVPLRATLKQFEALWRGPMRGQLKASLRRDRGDLQPDSYVRNELGTDLKTCYLLVPTSSSGWPDRRNVYEVRCYFLGDLANGKTVTMGQVAAAEAKDETEEAAGKAKKTVYLSEIQATWLRDFRVQTDQRYGGPSPLDEQKIDLGQLNNALMLVSTFDEINRDMRIQVERSQGQHLDRSMAMTRESALLIGFSQDPGPAALCWRRPDDNRGKWKALGSEDDRKVMYRISIPVEP